MRHCLDNSPQSSLPDWVFEKVYVALHVAAELSLASVPQASGATQQPSAARPRATDPKSFLCSALYAKCPYYIVRYVRSVLIMQCFVCKMSLSCSALYAKCSYHAVLCMRSALIMQCFVCEVSLLCSALYAKCPYCVRAPFQDKSRF